MYKIFPCRADKTPLISGWQDAATDNEQQIKQWSEMFGSQLKLWGIPTGATNGLLVLDIDVKKANGYDTIAANHLPIPPSRSQRTSSGGQHIFYAYPRTGKHYGNRVNLLPGIDVRGDGGYVCFYENSQDHVPIAEAPEWLLTGSVKAPQLVTGDPVKISAAIAHETLSKAIAAIQNAPEGESNAVLNSETFRLGQLVKSGALERQFVIDTLYPVALARKGPGTEYECKRTIESGLDGGDKKPLTSPFDPASNVLQFVPPAMPEPPGPPPRWTPPQATLQQLLDKSKLRKPQLFEDWSTEDIHITTADGGTGKTTLKLFEAICLALGERFLGFRCLQPGKTLFITGEDTAAKLFSMMGEIIRAMGLLDGTEENNKKIEIIRTSVLIKKDSDLCLVQKNRATGFLEPSAEALRQVLEACEDIKPKMIVYDPISSFWGPESAVNDMNKAVIKHVGALVELTGACVEMINHMGKQSSSDKDMSQFAGRGGSGLPSNSRVVRTYRGVDEAEYRELTGEDMEPGTSAILIKVNKFTDGSPLYNKPFLVIRDGFIFARKELSKSAVNDVEKTIDDHERVFDYVKAEITKGKHVTKSVIISHFGFHQHKLSRERVTRALTFLGYEGFLGEHLKPAQGPDVTAKEQIYVITDSEGREL